MWRRIVGIPAVVILLLLDCFVCGAEPLPCKPADPLPINGKIEIGDLLKVTLFGYWGPATITTKRVRVAKDGTIDPLFEVPIKVVGLTPAEAPKAIRAACIEHFIEFSGTWDEVQRPESGSHPSVKPGAVAPGDVLDITVSDLFGPNTDISTHARVEPDGKIALPSIGLLQVTGLEERDVMKAIVKAYRDGNIIQHANVDVLKIETADQSKVRLGPIGFGDLLRVTMAQASDGRLPVILMDIRVGADGRAGIPHLGGIRLSGLTAAEAAVAIEKATSRAHTNKDLPGDSPVLVEKIESSDKAGIPVGRIRVGDVVHVWFQAFGSLAEIYQENYRVDEAGKIRLPYLGEVQISNLSELDAQDAIEKACKQKLDDGKPLKEEPFVSLLRVYSAKTTDVTPAH